MLMVNWLYEVITKLDLSLDTYFQSVQLIDTYYKICGLKAIYPPKEVLHLIGVACLFIANKYNDYKNLTTNFIVRNIVHDKYTEDSIIEMEANIFESLEYKLGSPTERTFAGVYCLILGIPLVQMEQIELQSQINLHSYKLSQCDPALVAAGSILFALHDKLLIAELAKLSKHTEENVIKMAVFIESESIILNQCQRFK